MAVQKLAAPQPTVIPVVTGTPLIFSHPALDKGAPFIIDTGASSIQWPYMLNMNITPTYQGEVVQILSAYVDAITIVGQSQSAEHLRAIHNWFLRYMQIAGLADRNQQAVTFQYPERGWQFLIQPTSLPNFSYNRDVIGVEWMLEAEIVQDDNVLSGYTMSGFTKAAFDPTLWNVGFSAESPAVNPLAPINHDDLGVTSQNIGNNFQSLIGAWSSGDFAHWAFDATSSPAANKLKNSKEYWTEVFGTDFITKGSSAANSGSSPYGGPANPTGTTAIAYMISQEFEKQGVPGKLGVAVAMAESDLLPDRWQGSSVTDPTHVSPPPQQGQTGCGLFQTTNVGGQEQLLADRAVSNYPQPITNVFSALQQATFAAQRCANDTHSSNLGQWAYNFQRPADEAAYIAEINGNLAQAQVYINQGASAAQQQISTPGGTTPLDVAKTQIGYTEGPNNENKFGESFGGDNEPWCSYFVSWCLQRGGSQMPLPQSLADSWVVLARDGKDGLKIVTSPEAGDLAIYDWASANPNGESTGRLDADSADEHVNFFVNWVDQGKTFVGLGGNQSSIPAGGPDQVNEAQMQASTVVAFVRVTQ